MRWFLPSRSAQLAVLALSLVACSDEHKSQKADAGDATEDAGGESGDDADGGASGSSAERDGGGASDDVGNGGDDAASSESDGSTSTPPPCGGSCDDGIDCTKDTCVAGACQHTLDASACQDGSSCNPQKGCEQGKACANDTDCADTDGCTVNERCDPALARCTWQPLDRDGDHYGPASCGGVDCNDADGRIAPSATETCNGVDDDCDGTVDDGASCGGGAVCTAGACKCPEGTTACGAECVDLKTSAAHCGSCRTSCGAGSCADGACSCGAPATQCGPSCVDTQTSAAHCGGCGKTCAPIDRTGQVHSCLAGTCTACGGDGQVCCGGAVECVGGLSCTGGKCACAGTDCNGTCADLSSDRLNCGACGTTCRIDENCVTSAAGTACAPCGGVGEACCTYIPGAPGACGRGLACGAGDTCVRITAP